MKTTVGRVNLIMELERAAFVLNVDLPTLRVVTKLQDVNAC